jgi:DNA-directed RNA polymerase specialized sigma subunit
MELYDLLSGANLSPRQLTILTLHYLEYMSWTNISHKLHIERRYALQVHIAAIERLSEQIAFCGGA